MEKILPKSEALDLLKQVCAAHKGILQEHQALQQALRVVEKAVDVPVPDAKEKKGKKEYYYRALCIVQIII